MTENLTSPAERGITLLSLNSSLQTGLLAKLISDSTKLPCRVIDKFSLEEIQGGEELLLIDCQERSLEDLQALIHEVQESEEPHIAALLNAKAESEHEELLDWPCVAGVFFTDTDQEQV